MPFLMAVGPSALESVLKVRRGSLESPRAPAMACGARVHSPMVFMDSPVVPTRMAFSGRTTEEAAVSLAAHGTTLPGIEEPFKARACADQAQAHPPMRVRPRAFMATQRPGTVATSSLRKLLAMCGLLTPEALESSAIL